MTENSATQLKLAIAVVVGLGAVAAAIWYPRAAPQRTPSRVAAAAELPTTTPAPAPRPPQHTPESAPAPAPVPAAGAPASSLEDVVSAAMPAVVRVETATGFGSGFFVKRDTLLTNVHVVAGNATVTIRHQNGRTARGRVDATAPDYDIAVIRVDDADGSSATLAMGSALRTRPGREIVALGTPLGLQNTVTRGIVSALRQVGPVMLVQTDAAINPGNSGGPLLDRSGQAIAIATMAVKPGEGHGLSFGVAIEHAQALLAGRLPTQSSGTPLSALAQVTTPQGPQPAQPAAPDAREEAARAFEQTVTRLARIADSLDDRWRSLLATCYRGQVTGSFDRPWFAVFDPRAMQGTVPPGCDPAFTEIRHTANRIRDELRAADETARRADVYPGTRRDLLRAHRLEHPSWVQ